MLGRAGARTRRLINDQKDEASVTSSEIGAGAAPVAHQSHPRAARADIEHFELVGPPFSLYTPDGELVSERIDSVMHQPDEVRAGGCWRALTRACRSFKWSAGSSSDATARPLCPSARCACSTALRVSGARVRSLHVPVQRHVHERMSTKLAAQCVFALFVSQREPVLNVEYQMFTSRSANAHAASARMGVTARLRGT